ncbi:MAG: CHAD domain-containing protein [Acidimicrobiales bacterium]|nr:CHAD domain-containing protein [Acidimicrobiales bacterium]
MSVRRPTTFTGTDGSVTAVVDALSTMGFEGADAGPHSRSVLDTFDGRLHAAGLRLELHDDGGRALVLWSGDGSPPAHAVADVAPVWPADVPAGPLRQRIAEVTKERALLPLLEISSQRRVLRRLDRRGKAVASVEVHERLEVDGAIGAHVPAWAAEVHAVVGHEDVVELLGTRLAMLGLTPARGDLSSSLAELTGRPLGGRSSSPTVPMDAADDALASFRRVLLNLYETIEQNLPGTVDDTDPEFLHELRVAVRRTRSVLAEGRNVLPDDTRQHFREVFSEIGQVTGPPRDLDVYVLGWAEQVAGLSDADITALEAVREELERRRVAAKAELARSLRSATTAAAFEAWRSWLTDLDVVAEQPAPIGPVVAARIARAQRKVLRDGRAITPASHPERLHDLRKDAKKLRYLLECFGGLLPTKGRKAFVGQLKALQDNLGEHQDAEVQMAQLRTLAHDLRDAPGVDTDVLLAIGRLGEQLDRRRSSERAAFADRFAAYDTKPNRRALDDLLAPLAQR